MREIKFRITYQHGETGRITQRFMELGQPIPHLGNDWAVIAKDQYTGPKDKNGKEIWEGDIAYSDQFQLRFTVEYQLSMGGFMFCSGKLLMGVGQNAHVMEIIGNVYENPELLTE